MYHGGCLRTGCLGTASTPPLPEPNRLSHFRVRLTTAGLVKLQTPNGSAGEVCTRVHTSAAAHTDETRDARGVIGNAAFNVRGRTKLPRDYKAAGVPGPINP